MAPFNGSVKSRKAGTATHQPKPVVPALPLTYAKRKTAATGRDASVPSSATSSAATAVHSPSLHAPSQQPVVNGEARKVSVESEAVSDPATSQNEIETPAPSESSTKESNNPRGQAFAAELETSPGLPTFSCSTISHAPALYRIGHDAQPEATSEVSPAVSAETRNESTHMGEQRNIDPLSIIGSTSGLNSETVINANAPAAKKVDHQTAVKAAKVRPPPVVSPSRYQIPPTFQPAPPRPYGIMTNGDSVCGAQTRMPNGAAHVHHSHPSNGSIHFGTFQDSQNTSPVPPHSGGIVPNPSMPMADGRAPYMPLAGNGFPPMMPYGAEVMQAANFDGYGRPAMGFGPMDAFPMHGHNFGPSTPHSFHDSQSSGQPEDNAMYRHYTANGCRNGGAAGPGEMDGPVHAPHGRMFVPPEYPRMIHGHGPPPPHLIPHDDNGDQLVDFMRQHFVDSDFVDCTLELRYVDDRAAPVRIPGHRLVFARSRVLGALLGNRAAQLTSDGNPHTLLLKTGDKWLRSDSFYMSVQRLYGLPLLRLPPRQRPDSPRLAGAGTTSDQLDFALSYAAAGHLLEWAPVLRRGCEVATQLLTWHSMEKLMEFALERYVDNGTSDSFKYGEGSRIILNALVAFIVHNLPPAFTLAVSSKDPERYARFPDNPTPPPPTTTTTTTTTTTSAKKPAAVIARGSSVQFGRGRRSQQIMGIQFGDLSLGEEVAVADSETPRATQQAQPVGSAVLSRVLINLPFSQLKMVLESASSGNVNGWANAETRYRVVQSAVEEREKRRLRALDAVLRGRVPDSEDIRSALRNPSPQQMGRWSALGWQEEILPYGNADGPALGRRWVPIFERDKDKAAAYP